MKQLVYAFLFAAPYCSFSSLHGEFVSERDYTTFLKILQKHDETTSYTRTPETEKQLEAAAAEFARRMNSCIEGQNKQECAKINAFFNVIEKSIASNTEEEALIKMIRFRMAASGFNDLQN